MDNPKKFLIIGATGLIGRAVSEEIGSDFEWVGTEYSRKKPDMLFFDITDRSGMKKIFENVKPTYVIHCANLAGGVDFCEQNPDLAKKFHFDATVNIGKQCQEHKAKFIFISSECVFDGKKESYAETDKVNPLSVYGRYKAQSEEWIKDNLEDYIIIRTMSVYGWDPLTKTPNAVMKVYFSIFKGEKTLIPIFRWSNPTYVKDLAKAILKLCLSRETGLFHIAGASFVSRYDWLKRASDALGWDSSLLISQETPNMDGMLRPLRIKFNTEKFQSKFKTKLHNLVEGLNLLKQDIEKENYILRN